MSVSAAEATKPGAVAEAEDFVRRFAEAWASPDPDGLAALVHPDAELIQPLMPALKSREEWREAVRGLVELMPDLRGEVREWSASGGIVFIEMTLKGTLAWRPFEWSLVDRIVLEDGLVRSRVSYFDSAPLGLEILKRPSRLFALLRLRRR